MSDLSELIKEVREGNRNTVAGIDVMSKELSAIKGSLLGLNSGMSDRGLQELQSLNSSFSTLVEISRIQGERVMNAFKLENLTSKFYGERLVRSIDLVNQTLLNSRVATVEAAVPTAGVVSVDLSPLLDVSSTTNSILRGMAESSRVYGGKILLSVLSIKNLVREWIRGSELDRRESEAERAARIRPGARDRGGNRVRAGREAEEDEGIFGRYTGLISAAIFASGAIYETVLKIKSSFDLLRLKINGAFNSIFSRVSKLFEPLRSVFGKTIGSFSTKVAESFEVLRSGLSSKVSELASRLSKLFEPLTSSRSYKFFETQLGKVTNFFKNIGSKIPKIPSIDEILTPVKNFFDKFRKIGEKISTGMARLRSITTVLDPLFETFDTLRAAFDRAKALFNFGRRFADGFFRIFPKLISAGGVLVKMLGRLALPITIVMGVFEGIMGAVKGFQSTEGGTLQKLLGGYKGFLVGVFDSIIGSIVNMIADLSGWILKKLGFEELGQAFQDFDITELYKSAITSFTGIFMKIFSKLSSVGKLAGKLGKLAGKLAWPITLITGIFDGIVNGFKAFQGTEGGVLEKLIGGVKGFIVGIFDSIVGSLVNLVSDFAGWVLKKLGFEELGQAFQDFDITELFKGAIASFTGIFLKLGSKIGLIGKLAGKLAWPITAIIGVFDGIMAGVKAFQSTDGGLLEKIMAGVGGFFIGVFDSVVGSLVNMASDLVGWILKKIGFEELGQVFQDFDITAIMKDLLDKVWSFVGSIVESIPMIFSQSLDFIVSIKDRIVESILGLGDRVIGAFAGMYEFIVEKINSILPSWLGGGNSSTETPRAPDLSEDEKMQRAKSAGYNSWEEYEDSGWQWKVQDLSEDERSKRAKSAGYNSWKEYEESGWKWKGEEQMVPRAPEQKGGDLQIGKKVASPEEIGITPRTAGQRLSEAGNPALKSAVTVINNNGGNVSNNTTSNQTNNSSANLGPIMTGSAMEM